MDNTEKPILIQCSQCDSSNAVILNGHIYKCKKCGFMRELVTQTEETEEMAHMPYTVEEWEMISNSQHVPTQDKKEEEKKEDLEDKPYPDWDDYPYIPVSQWLYKRH